MSNTLSDSLATSFGITHFYVRYLDVDWSEQMQIPVPSSGLGYAASLPSAMAPRYTPVIFITNRVFERISDRWCDDSLALKLKAIVDEKTKAINEAYLTTVADKVRPPYVAGQVYNEDSLRSRLRDSLARSPEEIQIDCDWTVKTRDRYFRFLRSLKKQFPGFAISATIRLFPYKYPGKMGVPPVDRGMLMCYNMDRVDNSRARNSVFDLATMKQYLTDKQYPLPLDAALPVFGWYAWFRGNTLKGIIYPAELGDNDLRDHFGNSGNGYLLHEDYTIGNHYLREGDVLRKEMPEPAALEEAAQLLQQQVKGLRRISFFHWDTRLLNTYDNTIRKIYATF